MGDPDLVLIDREATVPCQTMRSLSHDWVLLYRDDVAELWGRRTRYDVPGHPDYFPPERRRIGNTRQDAPVPFPAFPEDRPSPTGGKERAVQKHPTFDVGETYD